MQIVLHPDLKYIFVIRIPMRDKRVSNKLLDKNENVKNHQMDWT